MHSCRGGVYRDVRIGMAPHWTCSIFGVVLLPRGMPVHCRVPQDCSHPQRLRPRSPCRVSIACAHTDVQFGGSRPLNRTRARKSAHKRRRMLLSSASVCRRYLRGHGCWLVIVDRHGRGLKATFQVRPGVDTNSKAGGATHGRFRAWQEHFRQFAW